MTKKYIFIPNQTLTLRDAKAVATALTAFMDGTEEALVLGAPGQLIAMDEDGNLELACVDELSKLKRTLDTAKANVRYVEKQMLDYLDAVTDE